MDFPADSGRPQIKELALPRLLRGSLSPSLVLAGFGSAMSANLRLYAYFPCVCALRFFKEAEEQGEHTHSEAHVKHGLGNDCRPVKYPGETKYRGDERDDHAAGGTS